MRTAQVVQSTALGEHVLTRFVEGRRAEWNAYRMQVTQWEVERYLEAFQAVGAVAVALARHPAGGGPQRVKGHGPRRASAPRGPFCSGLLAASEARYPHSGRAADWGIGRRDRAALCIAEAPPRCDEASQAERRVNDLERFFWANTGGTIRASCAMK